LVSSQIAPFTEFDGLRLYVDGRLADLNPHPQIYQPAQWSGTNNTAFSHVTVPVAAGRHHFRWVYEKGSSDAAGGIGQDQAFIDNIMFPTPQIGVMDIYDDPDLHDETDLNGVNPPSSPTVPAPTSTSQIRRLDTLYRGFTQAGDQNLHRQQGHIQIEQNQIFAAAQFGILVDAGQRDPASNNSPLGGVRNLTTLNNDGLVPGLTLVNNVVANSGQVGIRFSGDANSPDANGNLVPVAAVPFARIINNTVYGGGAPTGTGIEIGPNAGPTLFNNIVANNLVGIAVDPTSNNDTVLGANLFAGNIADGVLGTSSISLPSSSTVFVNPAARNYYLLPGSPAVDSAISQLGDRPQYVVVKSAAGIPDSPIRSPDRDLYFQARVDEPAKDRGAIERTDFTRPFATLIDPLDNDNAGRDRNSALNDVVIRNELLRRFVVKLNDSGVGIDDSRIASALFTIMQDDILLSDQIDYTFVYDPVADEAIFTPTSGAWPLNHVYSIRVDNSLTGVADLAGNTLQGNRATGEVLFTIFTGIVRDFGDAPSPKYATLLARDGASHTVIDGFRLGANVTEEQDGQPNSTATGDLGDDGVTFIVTPSPGLLTTIRVNASAPGVLDAWFDLNQDGIWDASEKLLSGRALVAGDNTLSFTYGTAQALRGTTFARFRFTSAGISTPLGIAPDGEVEDYQIVVGGPPFQNSRNVLDVNNDTFVSPIDALLIINFLNFYSRLVVGGNIPLPPTSPPFPAPAPVIDPTGGGVAGQGRYLDVDGNGFLTSVDAVLVINYLNSVAVSSASAAAGGEGEGAAAPVAIASATSIQSSSLAANANAPAVLYASSSVVIEDRERVSSTRQILFIQDQALLAIGPEMGPVAPKSDAADFRAGRLSKDGNGDAGGPTWDELLTDLAHDQKHLSCQD
jgi:Dockerin type I domain/GEVED domain